jgi:hypothetical protein
MDERNNSVEWAWIIGFCLLLFFGFGYFEQKEEIAQLQEDFNDCRSDLADAEYYLDQANTSIEEANSYIEDAQSYAWSTYEEMGYALESMSTVETVPY